MNADPTGPTSATTAGPPGEPDFASTRVEYGATDIDVADRSPYDQFIAWYHEAAGQVGEPNAMVVSTADDTGPSARIVLLKGVEADGFVFYTNYDSAKGAQIAHDPHVALTFPWHDMHRQVRIRGQAVKTSAADSDAYFATRVRGAQIGAHASAQSQVVDSRETMQAAYDLAAERFGDGEVPRPEHWGGYRVEVTEIEFWQGRGHRFHDRIVYRSTTGEPADLTVAEAWETVRLQP